VGQHLASKVRAEDQLMMKEQLGRWAPSIYPANYRTHPFTKESSGPGPPESAPITQIFI
jgi:hypothetical protein